ncbi:MAG TPA: transporter substrate-binding domain-containing protein [Methanocorpusculum sp.]|nr:transporter substrate-binding domain-containing protein [Methanocorpusculum sp.]
MSSINHTTLILCAALILTAVFLSAGCVTEPVTETKPVLLIAVNTEIGAYNFYDENGNLTGIDIEIAKKICDELGMEPAFEDIPFKAILPGVEAGEVDIAIAGITKTEERKKTVDFSNTYAKTWQTVYYNPVNGSTLKDSSDLKGKIIGVKAGTTGENLVKSRCADTAKKIVYYEWIEDAAKDLNIGEIDCFVFDNSITSAMLEQYPDFKTLDDNSTIEEYGIAVQKGNTELLNKINAAVDKFLADGTIDAINQKYLGKIPSFM